MSSRRPGRSFSGCLTCRKRKVKCDSQSSPCGNCHRMRISCKSSFGSNFIDSTPTHAKRSKTARNSSASSKRRQDLEPFYAPSTTCFLSNPAVYHDLGNIPYPDVDTIAITHAHAHRNGELNTVAWSAADQTVFELEDIYDAGSISARLLNDSPSPAFNLSLSEAGEHFDSLVGLTCQRMLDPSPFQYDASWTFQIPSDPFAPAINFELPYNRSWQPFPKRMSSTALLDDLGDTENATDPTVFSSQSDPLETPADRRPSHPILTPIELIPSTYPITEPIPEISHSWSPISLSLDSFKIPQQISMISVDEKSSVELPLVKHYESYMSRFFSAKAPQWNLYTYILRSPQGSSETPLRHSLLAWAGLHLSMVDRSLFNAGGFFYAAASNSVKELMLELSLLAQTGRASVINPDKVRMLLSACFFLSHCDIMTCDPGPFCDRLDALKTLFSQNWECFQKALGAMSSRLLLWMSYLDIRASLWGGLRTKVGYGQVPYRSLLCLLQDRAPLRSLYGKSRWYLSECFGNSYPKSEMDEDLVQESGNLRLLDAMSIFSQIISFENWNNSIDVEDPDIQDLRNSQICHLRVEITRIQSECQGIDLRGPINRTSFHWLTATALHYSATILLNRILEPNIKTDAESQNAARQLLSIALRLRKINYLRTPRSLVWPLPIFIAGIEISDEIYQDWTLSCLEEMKGWGTNMLKVRDLLEQVIIRQAKEGRRVKVRHIMEELGSIIII